jgi:hypothetical protein
MDTGEVIEPKRRLKDIEADVPFFEGLIADPKFNDYVEKKFKLTTLEMGTAEDDREDDLIESDTE